MPAYPWLTKNTVDLSQIPVKIRVMQMVGVPYAKDYDQKAVADYRSQAQIIVDELKASGVDIEADKQIVAMIAYLHKMGRDISPANQKK
jgi:cytochrome c oxidase cbb3-type subunit I/II